MKTNTRLLILATSALLLTACSEDNNTLGGPVKARITAGVSGPKVKAIDNRWNADKIGVMVTATTGTSTTMINKYKNVAYETSSTTMSADFDPVSQSDGIFFEDANAEFTFAAYAPYASSYGRSTLPGDNGKVPVNTEDQPNVAKQERIDYIYATGAKAGKNNPVISFINNTSMGGTDCSFKHKMARLILKVQVSEADGFTKPSVLRLANYKLGGLIHEGTFDILTGTATATGPVVNDWLLQESTYPTPTTQTVTNRCVAYYDADTGIMTLTMILLPQTLANNLKFEVSPDDGESQIYSNNDFIKPALEAGYSYTYTITVKKTGLAVSGSTIEKWNDGGSFSGDAKM